MTLVEELGAAAPPRDSYLSIGVFDGVHLGHQHVLELLKREAARAQCLAGVVTFRKHPQTVLNPGLSIPSITSVEERVRLLQELGIDYVVPVTFTLEVSRITAREFVTLLQIHPRMRGLVTGPDFALGHRREGTLEVLATLGRELGFSVTVAEALSQRDRRVSSTTIRDAIARGDIRTASTLLGRPFALEGVVVRGEGRGGNELGYPTANVRTNPELAIPGDGIYATWAYIGDQQHKAATSIGVRPTFGEGKRTVEAHVLDFQGNLYDQSIRLEFTHRLRDEMAFKNAEELKDQIQLDVELVRRMLVS